ARLGDHRAHSPGVGGGVAGEAGLALSGAASHAAPGPAEVVLGGVGVESPRPLLRADAQGAAETGIGDGAVAAAGAGGGPGAGGGLKCSDAAARDANCRRSSTSISNRPKGNTARVARPKTCWGAGKPSRRSAAPSGAAPGGLRWAATCAWGRASCGRAPASPQRRC